MPTLGSSTVGVQELRTEVRTNVIYRGEFTTKLMAPLALCYPYAIFIGGIMEARCANRRRLIVES